MNIYDVSSRANVSIATVSRVLNGNTNVSEKTREKVLSVMKELGYTPNVFARGLGLNTMNTIGIMCCDSSDPYLANAIFYLEQGLRSFGYDALLCCTGYTLANKQNYMQLMLSKRVDAIVLAGSMFLSANPAENQYILEAAKSVPIFLVNGYLKGENIHCTMCDDYTAVYQATEQMLADDRSSLFYLYSTESYSGLNKLRGFQDACSAHQITPRSQKVTFGADTIQRTKELLIQLHDSGRRYDAILTSEDALAVGAVKYAIARGISIPDELAILGYNNSIQSVCCEPELSSVDTRVADLCDSTVHTIMDVLGGGEIPPDTIIPASFVARSTTRHAS